MKDKFIRLLNFPLAASERFASGWPHYLLALLITLGMTLLCLFFRERIAPVNLSMLYLGGVIFAALYLGFKPGMLTAVTSVLTFDFIFVPPYWTFAVHDSEYLISFLIFILIAAVTSKLAAARREQLHLFRESSARNELLYILNHDLCATISGEDVATTALLHLHNFGYQATFLFVPQLTENCYPGPDRTWITDQELSQAQAIYDEGISRQYASVSYFLLQSGHGLRGVLAIRDSSLTPAADNYRLCCQVADQVAIALDRSLISEVMHQSSLTAEKETLRNSLLSSIAHDLRTPVTSLSGYASVLSKNFRDGNMNNCAFLAEIICAESQNLISLIENTLNITKMQNGLNLQQEILPVDEIILSAARRMKKQLANHLFSLDLDKSVILVKGDPHLLEQLVINLLENAVKYAPEQSVIEISTAVEAGKVLIKIRDEGPGIPSGEENKIFDKFYRLKRDEEKQGTGLGLAMCKAVAVLHGGDISVSTASSRGTTILVCLPVVFEDESNRSIEDDTV